MSGADGESRAAEYLKKKGYAIVGRNFKCRTGEIDVIAKNKDYLVFAEVKTRKPDALVSGAESVGAAKQARLRAAARYYLAGHRSPLQPRFDVITVESDGRRYTILEHIENAF